MSTTPRLLKRNTSEMIFIAPTPGSKIGKLVGETPGDQKNWTAIVQCVVQSVRHIVSHEQALLMQDDSSDEELTSPRTLRRRLGTISKVMRKRPQLLPDLEESDLPLLQGNEELMVILSMSPLLGSDRTADDVLHRIRGVASKLLEQKEDQPPVPVRQIDRVLDSSDSAVPVEIVAGCMAAIGIIVADTLSIRYSWKNLMAKPRETQDIAVATFTAMLEDITVPRIPPYADRFTPPASRVIDIDVHASTNPDEMRTELLNKLLAHPAVQAHGLLNTGGVLMTNRPGVASPLTQMLLTGTTPRATQIGLIISGLMSSDGADTPCVWTSGPAQPTMARYNPTPPDDVSHAGYFTPGGAGERYPTSRPGPDLHDVAAWLLDLDHEKCSVIIRPANESGPASVSPGSDLHQKIKTFIDSVMTAEDPEDLSEATPKDLQGVPPFAIVDSLTKLPFFNGLLSGPDRYDHLGAGLVARTLQAAGLIAPFDSRTFLPYHFTVNNCSPNMPGGLARMDLSGSSYVPLLGPFEYEIKIHMSG